MLIFSLSLQQYTDPTEKECAKSKENSSSNDSETEQKPPSENAIEKIEKDQKANSQSQHEKSLRNTFGWTRIDVLAMVICCVILTSLCFSIVVEVLQTLFHIDHLGDHMDHGDEYHLFTYEFCIILGALGLVLNGISYLLIGGYTYHQGSFLHLTADGNVYILDRALDSGKKTSDSDLQASSRKSQKIHQMSRDTCSAFFVIVCSIIIVFCQEKDSFIVKIVDPAFSIISIAVLLGLSYPYSEYHRPLFLFPYFSAQLKQSRYLFVSTITVKEAAQILLQTIPDTIDIEEFQRRILQKFPQIDSMHDLHIWQLTQHKFVSTAHMIFNDQLVYRTTINDIIKFFHQEGINIVTIQPEFKCYEGMKLEPDEIRTLMTRNTCLVSGKCRDATCDEKLCCRSSSESVIGDASKLDQVVSVKDVSSEELKTISGKFTSEKVLTIGHTTSEILSAHSSSNFEVHRTNQRSVTSLDSPPTNMKSWKRMHKAISVIDQEHQPDSSRMADSEETHLNKKFVSESVIKTTGNLDRQKSEILVENRLSKQVKTTNNDETENLYEMQSSSGST